MIYAPSLHFRRILEHVLKKIAPTDSPVYTSEIESSIVKIYKEMQAKEFSYLNAERDFDNFFVDGAYSSEELLSYIRHNHIKLTTLDKIDLELQTGLFEGDYETNKIKKLFNDVTEKFKL